MGHRIAAEIPATGALPERGNLGLELVALAVAVICVIVFQWQARDVIWGLWICSLTFGYATLVTTIVSSVVRSPAEARIVTALGGLFMLAFFSVHFGMFHFVHGVFLNTFFPLVGDRGFPNPLQIFSAALLAYWPLVLTTFISRFHELRQCVGLMDNPSAMMKPYVNVIRMHILIFVFAGLHAANLGQLAIFPVLAFYFVPWRKLTGWMGKPSP